ncbi:hypothetical protein BGW41_002603 [Actinomortierella wolfii]|nr:hypothetical protein BGW41_002603 [Actinomortierella wolfii]
MLPPPSAKTSKDDHIKKEGAIAQFFIHQVQRIGPLSATLTAALYVALMFKGYLSSELKVWHVAATFCGILGWQLRSWSFRTLDHFFTYELTIRPGHRLVTTGPYAYIRHPSYSGMLLTGMPWTVFMLYQGPYDVLVLPYTHVPMTLAMALMGGILYFGGFLAVRVTSEEKMLQAHFGAAWDDFARTRYRLVPFIF